MIIKINLGCGIASVILIDVVDIDRVAMGYKISSLSPSNIAATYDTDGGMIKGRFPVRSVVNW